MFVFDTVATALYQRGNARRCRRGEGGRRTLTLALTLVLTQVATYRAAGAEGKSADKAKAVSVLHAIMEKAVVLIRATGTRATSPSLAEVINEYATLLVAQASHPTAHNLFSVSRSFRVPSNFV